MSASAVVVRRYCDRAARIAQRRIHARRSDAALVVAMTASSDEEMETRNRYEQALRDNRFVVAVATPTDERKELATAILREHGGHSVAYFGKHTIEYITPPK